MASTRRRLLASPLIFQVRTPATMNLWLGFAPGKSKVKLTVAAGCRSEEHTSELQSRSDIVCRLLLEKKKNKRHDVNLLMHLKQLRLQPDAEAGDRLFWFTKTTRMMWQFPLDGLLSDSTTVLFDCDPT